MDTLCMDTLLELNVGFEYQGIQHQKPIEFFGGEEGFKKRKELDSKKKQLCDKNNCKLIYVFPEDTEEEVNSKIESVKK